MCALTAEHVRSLAPDVTALKTGQQLATAEKWSNIGATDVVLWGEIKGSGSKPYQVRVDLRDTVAKCSCPSRKLPCKHSLALMLVFCEATKGIPAEEPPAWVMDWLNSREKRANKKSTSGGMPDIPRDEESAAKRTEQRESRVDAGIAELTLWLTDLARRGLAVAREQPGTFWDSISGRMIDAQALGLARMVAAIRSALFTGEGWQERALVAVGRLHLLVRAYERLIQLSELQRAEVRTLIGWTQDKQTVLASQAVRDRWLVLGQVVDDSERVTSRRTWLLSEAKRQPAMLLDFSVAERPFEPVPSLGTRIDADVCFYAGTPAVRALIREEHGPSKAFVDRFPGDSIEEALDRQADALAESPWIERWPIALRDVVPTGPGGKDTPWRIRDAGGATLPLSSKCPYLWEIVAISGERPINLFGEWDGETLTPLSVATGGRFFALVHSAGTCTLRRIA